jgi:hypothetical protein
LALAHLEDYRETRGKRVGEKYFAPDFSRCTLIRLFLDDRADRNLQQAALRHSREPTSRC